MLLLRSTMAMVQLLVPVMMQQDQLIVCKATVDWVKASVIHDNAAHVLSVKYNQIFLAVDRARIKHWMILQRSDSLG
jgi:hypothetical protein